MKQALIVLIAISLFSFLSASIQCPTNLKVACQVSYAVASCTCVPKAVNGNFALTHSCTKPRRPTCHQSGNSIVCLCN